MSKSEVKALISQNQIYLAQKGIYNSKLYIKISNKDAPNTEL